MSTRAPGVMTGCTDAVTRAVDCVHWAGIEAAPRFEGYLEGAVRSPNVPSTRSSPFSRTATTALS